METDERAVNSRYKVGRVLEKYDRLDLHDDLGARWLGEDDREPQSLRALADQINQALVEQAMVRAGNEPLEGEAANAYQLLTDDEVSAGVRTQQRNRLERMGVDLDELEGNFVTHQAVHTYLTDGLNLSKQSPAESDPVGTHERRVNRLRSRTTAVIEDSLSSLSAGDHITVGSPDVIVDLGVYCHECGKQFEFADLLEQGGCDCQ